MSSHFDIFTGLKRTDQSATIMSSRGKSRSHIKLTNFPQQVIMLDNDYIHTFSTMSSLKNSKQTYSQTFRNKTSIKTTPRFY